MVVLTGSVTPVTPAPLDSPVVVERRFGICCSGHALVLSGGRIVIWQPLMSPNAPVLREPTAAITAPSNGAWTGNSIHVVAQATDNVGLATLKLYGDGVQFGQTNCGGATTCAWNDWWTTASLSTGQHTITAVATDLAGNTKTSIPVTINK